MGELRKAPAGWYDDGSGNPRYWDGDAWTDPTPPEPKGATIPASDWVAPTTGAPGAETVPTAPAPTTVAVARAPATSEAPAPKTRRPNALSITALALAVIGLISLYIPILSVVGSVLLTIALALSIVSFVLRGREWSALTAMIVSIVGIVLTLVSLVVIAATDTVPAIMSELNVPSAEATEDAADPSPEAEPIEEPPLGLITPASATATFGETILWDDGVGMSVSQPEPYAPTEFASGASLPNNVVFTVTITNGSDASIALLPYSEVTSGGQPATIIFDFLDSGEEISIEPSSVLEPGQSISWREAWSVADPNAMTMTNSPTVDHAQVSFTNQ